MEKIKINAKSAPIYIEFMAKINAGFKNIEIQLLEKEVSKQSYQDTLKVINEENADIRVVHTPLIPNGDGTCYEVALDRLLVSDYEKVLEECFKYCEYVAKIENHKIKMVVHNEFTKMIWSETNAIKEKIAPIINRLLKTYPDVNLVIENGQVVSEYGFQILTKMEDASYAVNELNKYVEPNRIFTLMDTCHLMMVWKNWELFNSVDETNWEQQFKNATEFYPLGLIHLNNLHMNGIGTDHGIAFENQNEKDMDKLKQIMENYKKYANCEITIEVREDDYKAIPKNLLETKASLESLGYQLDLG